MAINIINKGGEHLGVCQYDLMINDKLIAKFEHNRNDGLTVCLHKAAKAADEQKWIDALKHCDGGF